MIITLVIISVFFILSEVVETAQGQEENGKAFPGWLQGMMTEPYLPGIHRMNRGTGELIAGDIKNRWLLGEYPVFLYKMEMAGEDGFAAESDYARLMMLEGSDEDKKAIAQEDLEYDDDAMHLEQGLADALLAENGMYLENQTAQEEGEEEEQEQIGLYPGGSSFYRLSQHPSRTAARKLAKQHRNDRISELSMSGKKNKEIAAELGIALNTVTTVLGARRPRREEAWVMKRDGFGKDEIAEKLGVSVRTVERYLGAEPAQQPSPAGPESGSIDKKSEKPSQQNNLSSSDAGSSYELSGSREKETTPNSTKDVPPSDDNKDFSSETSLRSRLSPPPFFMRRRINPHKRAKKAEEEATNLDDSPSDSS